MSKAEERALKAYPIKIAEREGYDENLRERKGFVKGYHQAEKDVAEAFAKIIRGNLSMIDKSIQNKFEQLYTNITKEKIYKGFTD
jgi:hypothetical protein